MAINTPQTPNANQSVNVQTVNDAIKNYPDVAQKAPQETAATVTTDPSKLGAVQATVHQASYGAAMDNHQAMYNSQSWWKRITGDIGSGIKNVANWANKPLQEVQQDYKFIHAVWTTQGAGAGILATLGTTLGGIAGFMSGLGPEGAALGATAATSLERRLGLGQFEQANQKAQDPNYKVSIGRDLANGLSNVPGFRTLRDTDHGIGQFVSGITDTAFDFSADPLVQFGQLAKSLKGGEFLEYAKTEDGARILLDNAGKPIVIPTLKWAKSSPGVAQFLQSVSQKAFTSDMVLDAYNGTAASKILGLGSNPVKRAFDNIAEMAKNPDTFAVNLEKTYPGTTFTPELTADLAKAKSGLDVANIMGKSLYAGETAEKAVATTALSLPTRTLARSFIAGAVDKVLKKSGDVTLANQRNLLLPSFAPVLDENGNQVTKKLADGTVVPERKYQWGGLYTKTDGAWNGWNALAGKVRTFTGYKALSFNNKLLEQSGKSFTWDDKNLGTALYNMFYYAMPRDVALEKASEIMTAPLADKPALYAQGVKEVVKAAGLPDDDNIIKRVMSHAERSSTGGQRNSFGYGFDENGNALGTVEMKQSIRPDSDKMSFTPPQEVALWEHQRGSNAFINFNELRRAVRDTITHNSLYSKADDGWSYYIDKIFAPLTLFTTGFGLRVAGSEALSQVMRNGLGSYIQDKIATNGAKYKYRNMTQEERAARLELLKATPEEKEAIQNRIAMMTDKADHKAVVENPDKPISKNETTDYVNEKDAQYKELENQVNDNPELKKQLAARGRIRPIGWASSKIAPYLASDKMDVMLNWLIHMHGVSIPAGVASDHLAHYALNAAERTQQLVDGVGHGATGIEDLTALTGKDPHYHAYWAKNLSQLRNSQMARDIANDYLRLSRTADFKSLNLNDQWKKVIDLHTARVANPDAYKNIYDSMLGLKEGVPSSMAEQQVRALRGLVQGADGTIHKQLLTNVAKGKATFATDLEKIPAISSPLKVLGKEARPAMDRPIQRLTQLGYRTFINPVMDSISREPIFGHYLYESYRELRPLYEAGHISEAEAMQLAGQKAVTQMVPLIHNPALRSQFGMIARNFMPFYFAQEQAIKRYARLVKASPQAFREFQMINNGINNPGFIHQDSNGNKYIVYPMVGEFGNAVARALNALGIVHTFNLPESFTGNTSSLNTVLPEMKMPGLSTLASVPLAQVMKHFSWGDKVTNVATGGYPPSNWMDILLPNSAMRDMFQGLLFDQQQTSVANAVISAMAAAHFHGDLPDNYSALPPEQQQQILDRIDNNARTNLFMKGLFAFFAPLSPTVSNDYYNKNMQSLRTEFLDMLNQINPDTKTKYTLPEATAKFLAEHGNQAVSYTVSTTKTNTGGADLPLNKSTLDFLNNSQNLIKKYGFGAAYLIPQNAPDANALQVENDLLAKHLRSKETPQQFLDSVNIARGWADVAPVYNEYQKLVQAARNSGNRMLANQYTQEWNNYAQNTYGPQNPTWYSDYINPNRVDNANKSLTDLQTMNKNGDLKGPQASGIKELLINYEAYHSLLQQNTYTVAGVIRHTPLYSQYENDWFNYLSETEANNINLTNVINSVFKRVK